ncbi:Lcl C-terminal domain-containing protein [Pseudoalteromonas sp. GB56]
MKHLIIVSACFFSSCALAQTCYSLPQSTPLERFEINLDGTVVDTQTGLMWQRCSYGQSFDADTQSCTGSAQQLTWQQALQSAQDDSFAQYDDWLLPNAKELASIVEHNCVEPSVNLSVFLSASNDNYWSSTSAITPADHAWVQEFYSGKNSLHDKTTDVYVRLVRYQQ